jgi:trk system potassium uptake protein TrkA
MAAQVEANVRIKVARLRTPEIEIWRAIYEKLGLRLDLIIQPEMEAMRRILRVLGVPGVSDILDFADGGVKLFGMNIESDNWVCGKTLEELDRAGPPKNSLIAMIFRGAQVIIPHGGERLEEGDHALRCGKQRGSRGGGALHGTASPKARARLYFRWQTGRDTNCAAT